MTGRKFPDYIVNKKINVIYFDCSREGCYVHINILFYIYTDK